MTFKTALSVFLRFIGPVLLIGGFTNAVPNFSKIFDDMLGGIEHAPRITQVIIGFPPYFWICTGVTLGLFNVYNFLRLKNWWLGTGSVALTIFIPTLIIMGITAPIGVIIQSIPPEEQRAEQVSGDNATTSSDN